MSARTQAFLKIMSTEGEWSEERDAAEYTRLRERVEAHGIRVYQSISFRFPYGWNGKSIRIEGAGVRKTYDLAHEFGHYLVASPLRRHLKEFGLGPGFSTSAYVERQASHEICQFEENCTCLLAASILHDMGVPNFDESQLVTFVTDEKTWEYGRKTAKDVERSLAQMIAWGLMGEDLRPTYQARTDIQDP